MKPFTTSYLNLLYCSTAANLYNLAQSTGTRYSVQRPEGPWDSDVHGCLNDDWISLKYFFGDFYKYPNGIPWSDFWNLNQYVSHSAPSMEIVFSKQICVCWCRGYPFLPSEDDSIFLSIILHFSLCHCFFSNPSVPPPIFLQPCGCPLHPSFFSNFPILRSLQCVLYAPTRPHGLPQKSADISPTKPPAASLPAAPLPTRKAAQSLLAHRTTRRLGLQGLLMCVGGCISSYPAVLAAACGWRGAVWRRRVKNVKWFWRNKIKLRWSPRPRQCQPLPGGH